MMESTFMSPLHFGHFRASISQIFLRSVFDLQSDRGKQVPLEADSLMVELLDYYRATPMLYDPAHVSDLDSSSTQILEDLGYI